MTPDLGRRSAFPPFFPERSPAFGFEVVAYWLSTWCRVVEPLHRIDKADDCVAPFRRSDICFRPVLAAQVDRSGEVPDLNRRCPWGSPSREPETGEPTSG